MIHLAENKRIRPFDTIGGAIKHYRTKHGWTQVQLAERLGVSQGSIAHYEANNVTPPVRMLKKLSVELECSLTMLIDHKINFTSDE